MTGVARWNKTISKAGADGWNLTTDDGKGLDSSNVVVPVATKAERDGLTPPLGKYAGMVVARTDMSGVPLDVYDGSKWIPGIISTIWAATSAAIGAGSAGSLGALTLDTANSQNPEFITSPANSQLQVQLAGVYAFHMHVSFSPNTAGWLAIKNQAGTGTYALVNFTSGGEQSISIPNLYLATNTTVQFIITPATAQAAGVSAQIRATKIS